MQNETKKIDRRTAYTRMVIRDALYELLKAKRLPQITVKEICERADINRATFYRNYQDIYDLFEKTEEELTESALGNASIEEGRYRLLEVIYENQDFYREFFDAHLESRFVKGQVDDMRDRMSALLRERGTYDEHTFEVSYQYNYHGVVGVIRTWLDAGCPEGPRELGDVLYGIVEKQYR